LAIFVPSRASIGVAGLSGYELTEDGAPLSRLVGPNHTRAFIVRHALPELRCPGQLHRLESDC
jgi:hypothetical protein